MLTHTGKLGNSPFMVGVLVSSYCVPLIQYLRGDQPLPPNYRLGSEVHFALEIHTCEAMRINLRPEGRNVQVLKGLHFLTVFSRSKEEAGMGREMEQVISLSLEKHY